MHSHTLCISFLNCVFILFYFENSVCTDPQYPVLPPSVGFKMFSLFSHNNEVELISIYYDSTRDMAMMFSHDPGETIQLLFLYKRNMVFAMDVENKACEMQYISRWRELNPKEFLQFLFKDLDYDSIQEVNGINVTQWNVKNIINPNNDTEGIEDAFVTIADPNWIFPSHFKTGNWSKPVSVMINGKRRFDSINLRDFQEQYYFMDVTTSIPANILPPLVNCPSYSTYDYDNVPELLDVFQLESESYNSRREKSEIKIYVNTNANVIREDVRIIKGGSPSYNTTVLDKTFKIKYMFDQESGVCNSAAFFSQSISTLDSHNISVSLLFLIRNLKAFRYVGNRSCRLGECEVWSYSDYTIYYEIYWKRTKQVVNGTTKKIDIPVKMDISSFTPPFNDKKRLSGQHHYFNYEFKYPDWSLFDVSDCYNETDLLRFQMVFKGSYYTIESVVDFTREFQRTIKKLTSTPEIRINKIRVDSLVNEFIMVTATLIEDPKYTNLSNLNFIYLPVRDKNIEIYNKLSDFVDEKKFNVTVNNASGVPVTFIADTITKDIMSEKEIDQQGSSLAKFDKTEKMTVTSSGLTIVDVTVDECAKTCDQERSTKCDMFVYCKSTATCTLSEKHIEEHTDKFRSTDCNVYSRQYAYDYKLYEGVRLKLKDDSIVSEKDLRLCLSECFRKQNDSFGCHSIDYCTDGTVFTCAYHTRHYTQVSLREIIPDPQCIHYSQNFVEMYQYLPGMKWIDSKTNFAVIKRDVDLNECAQSCTLDPAGCTDFEMCQMYPGFGRKTQCVLYEPIKSSETYPKFDVTSNNCDHYTFKGVKTKFNFDTLISTTTSSSSSSTSAAKKSGYSGNDMAGLGIGMLLLGSILGFFMIYFYVKQQTVRGNSQNIVMQLINR